MKWVRESDNPLGGVDMVPVIGVALIILLVLMVISPIMTQPNLPVDLPEAFTKETKDENISVSMGADGRVSINTDIVAWEELPSKLRLSLKGRSDVVIIVRADRDLPYGAVEKLIRVVNRNAGRNAVAVATRQRTSALEVGGQ